MSKKRSKSLIVALAIVGMLAAAAGWKGTTRSIAIHQFRLHNYEAAETWFDRASWLPWWTFGDNHYWRARLARKLLETRRAESELELAQKAGYPSELIRKEQLLVRAQSGQLTEILPDLQAWLAHPDDESPELCESFTNGLLINSLSEDAAAVVHAWKQEYPQDPLPYLVWGRWLESQQRIDVAEQEYRQALTLRPDFAPAHYALGRLLLNQGADVHQAAEEFARAAAQLKSNAAPRIGEARCLDQLGHGPQAREVLERVLASGDQSVQRSFALVQDPDPTLPGERLLSEILTGLGEFDRALPLLDRLLEREPRDPTLRYLRAQCLQGTGHDAEAQTLFQEVADDRAAISEADELVDEIRRHPNDPQIEARYRVGELFWKHDSTRKAEYWLRNTLALAPDHPGANRLMAECYELRAKFDPAMKVSAEYHRKLGGATTSLVP